MERVASKWGRIIPSLPENSLGIADGRALHRQLDVVPWRPRAINGGHCLVLGVAAVMLIVTPTMTQVYATDECDIAFGIKRVSQNDQFLVVGSERTDTHIEEALTASGFDLFA